MRRPIVSTIVACAALGLSGLTIYWLRISSAHADRPPLFAVAAFLLAVVAGIVGLVLAARTASRVLRTPPEAPE